MKLPEGFIGPRRPWHVAVGLSAEAMAANLAEASRERSTRELAKEVWWEEFGRLRDAGFLPGRVLSQTDGTPYSLNVARICAEETRNSLRKGSKSERECVRIRPDSRVPVPGRVVYCPIRDKYVTLGDADDSTPFASEFDPEQEAEHKRFAEAEKAFAESVEAETGNGLSVEEWMARKIDREEMRKQSHEIANKLELGGTLAYRTDEYQLLIWHVFSQQAENIPAFRRLCFIPHVAAMVRAQKLAALEFFLDCNPYCRFWTFTSGERVALSGLRARIQTLHQRLNKLNKELRRRYGAELVFRSTELGTIETPETAGKARAKRAARAAHKLAVDAAKKEGKPAPVWTRAKDKQFSDTAGGIERDEHTGQMMFHPHAHCVVKLAKRMPKEKWSEMLRFVWSHWGDHWDDGKIIEDAREAVKYCLKPGDVAALQPDDLCALEKEIRGLRLVTPMGVLKSEIAARKKAGDTLRRVRTPEGMVWTVVPDHNKQLSRSEADKERVRKMNRQTLLDRLDVKLSRAIDTRAGFNIELGRGHAGSIRKPSGVSICRVVARLAPAAVVSPLKEPRVVVMATRGAFNRSAVMNHPLTVKLWDQGIQAWSAGRAIRVHTGTPTGETRTMELLAETEERYAPATEPIWEASIPAVPVGLN